MVGDVALRRLLGKQRLSGWLIKGLIEELRLRVVSHLVLIGQVVLVIRSHVLWVGTLIVRWMIALNLLLILKS